MNRRPGPVLAPWILASRPPRLRTLALATIALWPAAAAAQGAPTLALAGGKVGITSNEFGRASDFEFQMEAAGWPRAVTAGETVFLMGSWPEGNDPTISDDQSNPWAAAVTCNDATQMSHGLFYAVDAAANTSLITETHASPIGDGVFDWAHFYDMATDPTGFVDGSSCRTGVTPSSNAAPNLSGTAYTTAASGDLILTCVYVEQQPLGQPNPITSITWPAGFVGLSEETTYGHACAYGVQTSAGPLTPTFTVAQQTHDTFTIVSAAFKAGAGGIAPQAGASILLSEMHYVGCAGQTDVVHLPCPDGTTNVTLMAEAGDLTAVTDSEDNLWEQAPIQPYNPSVFYVNGPSISDGNAYTVSMTFNASGNYDLVGLYCLGDTAGVDTAATAQNGSTLDGPGSGATFNNGPLTGTTFVDAPSLGTSAPGDLVLDSGPIGVGPATGCVAGHCVFDYVGSMSWTDGDNNSYSNGDLMGHAYASQAGTVDFEYTDVPTGSDWTGMAIAFKSASPGASAATSASSTAAATGAAGSTSGTAASTGGSTTSTAGAATTTGGRAGTGATTGRRGTTGSTSGTSSTGSGTGAIAGTSGSTSGTSSTGTVSSTGSSAAAATGTTSTGTSTPAASGCGCTSCPEPPTLWSLLAAGSLVGGLARRRRRHQPSSILRYAP